VIEAVTFVCHTYGCAWLNRERAIRQSTAMVGPGLFVATLVVCECGKVPERQASMIAPDTRKAVER
jgi:hypothetical protein